MGDKTEASVFIDGQEIKAISESELTINYEKDTVERDCEIQTTHGIIKFRAVFTWEQWRNFIDISKKRGVI